MTILFDEKDLLHNEFGKRNGNNNKKKREIQENCRLKCLCCHKIRFSLFKCLQHA